MLIDITECGGLDGAVWVDIDSGLVAGVHTSCIRVSDMCRGVNSVKYTIKQKSREFV